MAGVKREPQFTEGVDRTNYWRFMAISKADWAEIAHDLFIQMEGEDSTSSAFLTDAERRLEIIKRYRKAK